MSKYHVVIPPKVGEVVQQGAFDHWVGHTVPLRGPDRRIIGEAKVLLVESRRDGNVCVVVESKVDLHKTGLRPLKDVLGGREGMSFRIPHQPKRDDDVARWLRQKRNQYNYGSARSWMAIDDILDEYRARADFGLTLDDDITQLPDYGSGDDIARA